MPQQYPRRPARRRAGTRPHRPAAGARTPAPASALDQALTASLSAPVPTVRSFAELGLPAAVVTALADGAVQVPFPIQTRAVPDALAGRDVLGRAETGSGKTLAFGLPMLARLAAGSRQRRERAPRALVLAPTRELARQIADVLTPLCRSLGLRLATVYGGVPIGPQIDQVRRGLDVVVATPGRLIDLLDRSACTLDRVEVTVLDEADHMADLGFLPAVTRILDATPASGQRMLFSATLDRAVERLVRSYLREPAVHAVAPTSASAAAADHRVFVLPTSADKAAVAAEIAARPARTLFFVRTKHGADRLARQLHRAGVEAAAIHGNRNQNQRERALAGFAAGHPRVLVATDVAARGIHVDDVDLVVHYDPPNDHKDYLHRSGRTARAGATGTVVALVDPSQVTSLARLHDAAGITPSTDRVRAGDRLLQEIPTSATPLPTRPERHRIPATPTVAAASRGGRRRRRYPTAAVQQQRSRPA